MWSYNPPPSHLIQSVLNLDKDILCHAPITYVTHAPLEHHYQVVPVTVPPLQVVISLGGIYCDNCANFRWMQISNYKGFQVNTLIEGIVSDLYVGLGT